MRHSLSLPALIFAVTLVGCDSVTKDVITGPAPPEVSTSAAAAQVTTTLTGEMFIATGFRIDGDCRNGFSFFAEGIAEGPYPGTFTEKGRLEADGSFSASFIINSSVTITGKKFSPPPLVVTCYDLAFVLANGTVPYVADIGGFQDQGFAFVDLMGDPVTRRGNFNESFQSTVVQEEVVVILNPPVAENPVGTSHTVTAIVIGAATGQPQPGVTVRFTVSSLSGSGFVATGTCTTEANGECQFTYAGPQDPDVHRIDGCPEGGTPEGGTPEDVTGVCGKAFKVFFLRASTPGQVTGGGHILHAGMVHGVSFGFNAKFTENQGHHGRGVVVDHRNGTRIKIVDVTHVLIMGTHATIRGNAEVDGVSTPYTMDVDDLGEPGTGRDTFKIMTENGYVAAGILTGGNIQIHK